MQTQELFASVDLGSNSFRLEIGQLLDGNLRPVEYHKETVRLGNGLDEERNLKPEAIQRGLACLSRFGERLASFKSGHVRAVATQTLREARNRDIFLKQAKAALGFPIEVITGKEEARLIYLGVSHLLPASQERRLVIDIGGRSTELILGKAYEAQTLQSYRLGSVAWSMKYFENGIWTNGNFKKAQIAAQAVLDEALELYPSAAWDRAYGSSGTVGAVVDILELAGLSKGFVTVEGLEWLQAQLIGAQKPEKLNIEGLKDDRRLVIGGGLSILRAAMELLDIKALYPATGALRHGALFDLIDRETPGADVRDNMIDWLAKRFGVDLSQALRVKNTALQFLQRLQAGERSSIGQSRSRELGWAAKLHELGMYISHSDYHKHGAYILETTDMPGFTIDELRRIGQLVLGHRGKLGKLGADLSDEAFAFELLSLRLAALLCHARHDPSVEQISLRASNRNNEFVLQMPPEWHVRFPQSAHLLLQESIAWQKTPWKLEVRTS